MNKEPKYGIPITDPAITGQDIDNLDLAEIYEMMAPENLAQQEQVRMQQERLIEHLIIVSNRLVKLADDIRKIYSECNWNEEELRCNSLLRQNAIIILDKYKTLSERYEELASELRSINPAIDLSQYPKQ